MILLSDCKNYPILKYQEHGDKTDERKIMLAKEK